MISEDAIRTLAHQFQTTELNVRREYFQHLFLSYFYRQSQTEKIYFKGGTALRMLYHSPRFSEDLDFSAALTRIRPIEQAILGALEEIGRENIRTDFAESKETRGGYFTNLTFESGGKEVLIQVNISLREGKKKGEVITVASDYLPAYTTTALVREQLVGEKIQALLARKKPRDFYDLYFILRANLLSPRGKEVLGQAREALQHSRINFEKELKVFLPKSHWPILRNFPRTLDEEIERFM